ncbi:MAG: T9SS type A sorting domain-containing protein [Ignavibacteriales bacterium]|nr:T9SS type A sorting domain-containing protein [Ignavibacteriales bacterium]
MLSGDSHTAAMDNGVNAGLPEIMAAGLDITNSKTAMIFATFGMNIWNAGGQGLTTPDFFNAFGHINVFGKDSVRLQLIDEFGTEFARLTVPKDMVIKMETFEQKEIAYTLEQNFPNPFNNSTKITYTLPEQGNVTVTVYNSMGERVSVLENKFHTAGAHSINFKAAGLPSGVYFYELQSNGVRLTKKFVLLK